MSESVYGHPDNRGVFIELWTIDLLEGDLAAALLYSQVLWWHQPGKNGRPKVTHERNGHVWLVRPDDGWEPDCRLTTKQVRRVRSVLVGKGLIEHRRFKVNGAPTSAWRPIYEAIPEVEDPIRPIPELPLEGQFHGSTPGGAVPSDPQGVVPSSLSTTREIPRPRKPQVKAPFPAPGVFKITEAMREWAGREVPGVDLTYQTRIFADHFRANGERKLDWEAAWRNWMRRSLTFTRPSPSSRPVDVAEESTNQILARRNGTHG